MANTGAVSWFPDTFTTLSGIPSGEAFGEMVCAPFMDIAGIASGEAFGTLTLTYNQDRALSGVPSGEGVGEPIVAFASDQTTRAVGIGSAEAVGHPTLIRGFVLKPTGIASAQAFGTMKIPSAPKFDAYNGTQALGSGAMGLSLTVTAGAFVVIDFASPSGGSFDTPMFAGKPMTQVANITGGINHARWVLANSPGGAQNFSVNWGAVPFSAFAIMGRSYLNVAAAADTTTKTVSGTSISDSQTCSSGQIIVNAISSAGTTPGTPTGGTVRGTGGDGGDGIAVMDSTKSTTFAMPGSSSGSWVAVDTILSAPGIFLSVAPPGIASAQAFGTMSIGGAGATPTFDATGSGATASTSATRSLTINATAGSYVFLDIFADRPVTLSNVNYDGHAMTLIKKMNLSGGPAGTGAIYRYGYSSATGGSKTVTFTQSDGGDAWTAGNAVSIKDVHSIATAVTATGTSSPASQSVSCTSGQLILECMAFSPVGGLNIGSPSPSGGTNRWNAGAPGTVYASMVINTATATTSFSATAANMGWWGAMANVIS